MRQLAWINEQSPRRSQEMRFVREPLFAAWIATLAPEPEIVRSLRTEISATLAHYRYEAVSFPLFCGGERVVADRRDLRSKRIHREHHGATGGSARPAGADLPRAIYSLVLDACPCPSLTRSERCQPILKIGCSLPRARRLNQRRRKAAGRSLRANESN